MPVSTLKYHSVLDMEGLVRRRYVNHKQVGSFSGLDNFYKVAKPKLSKKAVEVELKKIPAYYLHRARRIRYPTRKVFVRKINEQWAIDLADIQKHSRFNNKKRYILCVVDVFSKRAWLEAIPNKSAKVVALALQKIFNRAGVHPEKIQCDFGKEFYNGTVKKLLKDNGIKMFSVHSEKKCCIVERFIRTIFGKISRYLSHHKTRKFIDKLSDFEWQYNNSFHRSIGMKPSEVDHENQNQVFKKLYGNPPPLYKKSPFKVGDKCLVAKRKTTFEKGYTQNYLDEIFYIKRVLSTTPTSFILQDQDNTELKGSFYVEQLLKL
jgi:integrase-like protein